MNTIIYDKIKELENSYFSQELYKISELKSNFPHLSEYDYKIFQRLIFVGKKKHFKANNSNEFKEAIYEILTERQNGNCRYEIIVNKMLMEYYNLILKEISTILIPRN